MRTVLILAALPLLAGGCVRTVAHVVTAPVRVTSKAVDWTTTSQSEADRNYGRKMRKQEAREGRERRKAAADCRRAHGENCER
ncbi:hypothetical protein PX554_02580 [Sphingomonas sp. H39-1-10]|uniref:hypothetical protein n=1 Tax=Sphingomonas TaxID=13687 RepID=UPI00088F2544|nr:MULTISPECIES: hypothetical protein [Sphingomonas]MDF0487003.1 hypothetical protein [Sphingomonas pollutisoli]SDA27012.1 hypothetical protein SAMN03159340_02098 [Sphingomonas sp. NFR15]